MKDPRGTTGYNSTLSLTPARDGGRVVYAKTRPLYPRQDAGWAPRLVWTGAENLAYTGIRSPDRPARLPICSVKRDLIVNIE